MKATTTSMLFVLSLATTALAQNQITTPTGQPLVIGNQGVKHATLTSASPTQASNGKVLSLDANGLFFLAPDAGGQWTNNVANIFFNTGNVGLGTNNPLQRLDVNGDINIPTTGAIRAGNRRLLHFTGTRNIILGENAGYSINTAADNTLIGPNAGYLLTNGTGNTFLGAYAGYRTEGGGNTFFGANTGVNNTAGIRNLFLGNGSGMANSSGSENTAVGNAANFGANNLTRATAIGAFSTVNCSNCLVLGHPTISVGIGTNSPATRLHVVAGGTTTTGVRLQNLATITGTAFRLYVDADGNVMRASSSGLRESAELITDQNWTLTPDNHLVNTNTGGIVIGKGLDHTPTGYSLYVAEGIMTERVKVALKNTDEWRDNVFQPGYKLRSIEEVAQHIEQHKHLPGVPTATEMLATGNDLQKTDAMLLEKIEEMMLYIIELKKENDKLKKSIELHK